MSARVDGQGDGAQPCAEWALFKEFVCANHANYLKSKNSRRRDQPRAPVTQCGRRSPA